MKSLHRIPLATTASAVALSVAIGLGGVAPAGAEEPATVSIGSQLKVWRGGSACV